MEGVVKIKALCLFCDVYGFSNEIKMDPELASAKLLKLHHITNQCFEYIREAPVTPVTHRYFLSDCLFGILEIEQNKKHTNNIANIECYLGAVASLYDQALKEDISLRGYVSFGECMVGDNFVSGSAIVEAVRAESMLGLPAIVLPEKTIKSLNEDQDVLLSSGESCFGTSIDIPFGEGVLGGQILTHNMKETVHISASKHQLCRQEISSAKAALQWYRLSKVSVT